MSLSKSSVGLIAASAAALLWAISGVCGKVLMTGSLSPARLVFYRSTLGTLLLLPILLWHDPSLLKLPLRRLPFFLVMGTAGLALTQFTYYSAIQSLSVGLAILLQYLAPLWIVLFERLFSRIPITPVKAASLILALAGCGMVSAGMAGNFRWGTGGVLLGIAAGVSFAAYGLMTKHALKSHRELTVLFYSLLVSAVFWALFGPDPWQPLLEIGALKYWMIGYVAAFGTVAPFLLFTYALRHLQASHVSITSTLEPVIAAFIAWVFLDETLTGLQLAGGGCVLLAIYLLQRPEA